MKPEYWAYEIALETDQFGVARLVGIGLYIWLMVVGAGYALSALPSPSGATSASSQDAPAPAQLNAVESPLEALKAANPILTSDGVGLDDPERFESAWEPGLYSVLGAQATPPVNTLGELPPGLYATPFNATDCSYQLHRANPVATRTKKPNSETNPARVIAEDHLVQGRLLVSINETEPDWFTSSNGCAGWIQWEPAAEPLKRAGNGDYWIGDLTQGQWQVPAHCHWSKVVAFRGAELADIIDSGGPGEVLVVDDSTLGVRIRGCVAPTAVTYIEPKLRTDPSLFAPQSHDLKPDSRLFTEADTRVGLPLRWP